MTSPDSRDFDGVAFRGASFRGARFRFSDVSGVVMRGVELDGLDVDGHDLFFGSLLVNGVDVVPLVDAELDRRFPGREHQRAQDVAGLRTGWVAVQAAWEETVTGTPPHLVDAHVDDEWSLAETLRHLVLATDTWLRRAALDVAQPFHPVGLLPTGGAPPGVDPTVFRTDTPSLDEVLAARADRQQQVTDFLAVTTDADLEEDRPSPWGGDWRPTVGDCVRVVLEEEWAHLRYVRRDLALLG